MLVATTSSSATSPTEERHSRCPTLAPHTNRCIFGTIAAAAIASVAYAVSCRYAPYGAVGCFLAAKFAIYASDLADADIETRIVKAIAIGTITAAGISAFVSMVESPDTIGKTFNALAAGTLSGAICAANLTAGLLANRVVPTRVVLESGKIALLALGFSAFAFYMRNQFEPLRCQADVIVGLASGIFLFLCGLKPENPFRREHSLSERIARIPEI
ncbi:MAG: hypothetical protein KR126chlam1_00048 [Chlamydiae bacterium]|nr:hypothetical protein [Chlamydiota bacterium]